MYDDYVYVLPRELIGAFSYLFRASDILPADYGAIAVKYVKHERVPDAGAEIGRVEAANARTHARTHARMRRRAAYTANWRRYCMPGDRMLSRSRISPGSTTRRGIREPVKSLAHGAPFAGSIYPSLPHIHPTSLPSPVSLSFSLRAFPLVVQLGLISTRVSEKSQLERPSVRASAAAQQHHSLSTRLSRIVLAGLLARVHACCLSPSAGTGLISMISIPAGRTMGERGESRYRPVSRGENADAVGEERSISRLRKLVDGSARPLSLSSR
jgi:hypothetical protein